MRFRLSPLLIPLAVTSGCCVLLFSCSSNNDPFFSSPSSRGGGVSGSSSSGASGTSGFLDDADAPPSSSTFPARAILKSTLLGPDFSDGGGVPDGGGVADAGDACSGPLVTLGSFGPPPAPISNNTLLDGGRGAVVVRCTVAKSNTSSESQWRVSATIEVGGNELVLGATLHDDESAANDNDADVSATRPGERPLNWNNCATTRVKLENGAVAIAERRAWIKVTCGNAVNAARCGMEAELRLEDCARQ